MLKLLFLLLLRVSCAFAQTVEGSVLNAATGLGAAGVKVELVKGGTAFYETTTDAAGRFRFDNIREDDYAARYQSPDYWLTAGVSDYPFFHVAAGSPVKLESRMMPWSRISGRVVDFRGNPVANAPLELIGSGMTVNGRTYLRTSWGGGGGGQLGEAPGGMTFRGTADARGKFEVQVMPGNYSVAVLAPPGLKPPHPDADGPALAWKRTWYPGVTLPESKSKIVLLPGGEVSDIELKLLAVPAYTVRGVVLNPDGTPASKVAVMLGGGFTALPVASKPDGTFELAAVPEGEWLFRAEAQSGGVKLRATEWIEVAKHDLESLKLRLAPPLTIQGRVVVEAPKDAPALRPLPLILSMRGGRTREESDLGPGTTAFVNPNASGEFIVADAYPGAYQVEPRLQPPPAPYYLDAVRAGDADLLTHEVELSSDLAITVVYKADGGSVVGTAENCASGGVLLVPRDPSRQHRGLSRSGPCDTADRYEVRAVRPGDYYALAFAGNGPVVTVDEALLSKAAKVTVRADQVSTADVRAVTRPVF